MTFNKAATCKGAFKYSNTLLRKQFLSLLALLMVLAGCNFKYDGDASTSNDGVDTTSTKRFANELLPGDALYAGQQIFLNETFGAESLNRWPNADFLLQLMEEEPDVFGNQFEKFGFIADKNNEFPFGIRRGTMDDEKILITCVLCHATELPDGRLWIGAPATQLKYGDFLIALNDRWVAAGYEPLYSDQELQKFALLGPGRMNAESGSYPKLIAVDFPPYFNLGQKHYLNYLGTGEALRTEVFFAVHTQGAGTPEGNLVGATFPEDNVMQDLIDYLGAVESPAPPAGDSELLERGRAVFEEANCDLCHDPVNIGNNGVTPLATDHVELLPGDNDAYPRGLIDTSPLHRLLLADNAATDDAERLSSIIQLIVEKNLSLRITDGYRVPDLRGLWATAPYLHNGSVPSLSDLLKNKEERQVAFMRSDFEMDTRREENTNQGHEFGTALAESDKAALIEYLLSL